MRDPIGRNKTRLGQGLAIKNQHGRFFAPQSLRDGAQRLRCNLRARGRRQRRGDRAAFVPGGVSGQDQRGDLPRCGVCRLHRGRGIRAYARGRGAGAYPVGRCARQAVGVGGERRIEGPVVARLVADDIDHGRMRAARIVHIGDAVGETRPAVEQRRRRLAGHAAVAVGRAGHHGFGHAEDAAHALDLVQRGDEMHFGGAGVGKTGIHAAGEQRADEAFGAIHGGNPFECEKAISRSRLRVTGGANVCVD
jgi:hypothetical protein